MSSPDTVRSRLASIIEQVDTSQRRKLVLPFRSLIVPPGSSRELVAYPQHFFAARRLVVTVAAPQVERSEPLLESDLDQVYVTDLRTGTQSNFSTVGDVPIRSFGNNGERRYADLHLPPSAAGILHTIVVNNRGTVPVVVCATMFGDAMRSNGVLSVREAIRQLYEEVPPDVECLKPQEGGANPALAEHLRRIACPPVQSRVSSDTGPTTTWIAFSEALLAPLAQATMEVLPQEDVQITELDFSASLPRDDVGALATPDETDRLLVQDVLVGGVSQFVGSGDVPISHFKGQKLGFDRVACGQTVALRVVNAGSRTVRLAAVSLAGREVR